MKLPEEITHGDYAGIVAVLARAGSPLPERAGGSDAVRAVLRGLGVPEEEDAGDEKDS